MFYPFSHLLFPILSLYIFPFFLSALLLSSSSLDRLLFLTFSPLTSKPLVPPIFLLSFLYSFFDLFTRRLLLSASVPPNHPSLFSHLSFFSLTSLCLSRLITTFYSFLCLLPSVISSSSPPLWFSPYHLPSSVFTLFPPSFLPKSCFCFSYLLASSPLLSSLHLPLSRTSPPLSTYLPLHPPPHLPSLPSAY